MHSQHKARRFSRAAHAKEGVQQLQGFLIWPTAGAASRVPHPPTHPPTHLRHHGSAPVPAAAATHATPLAPPLLALDLGHQRRQAAAAAGGPPKPWAGVAGGRSPQGARQACALGQGFGEPTVRPAHPHLPETPSPTTLPQLVVQTRMRHVPINEPTGTVPPSPKTLRPKP